MLNSLKSRFSSHKDAALEGLHTMKRKPLNHIMTIVVISLALALPVLLWIFVSNLSQFTGEWQRGGHITLYLKQSLSQEESNALLEQLKANKNISEYTFKSPEEGLQELMKQEGMQDLMKYLPENPLPGVVEIVPALAIDAPAKLDLLYRELQKIPEVDQAKLDMDWVKRLHAIFSFSTSLAVALMSVLALAVVFITGNSLRLTIHNRHQEIQVLKLIGATDAFILRPFLYQGLGYGLSAAALACMLIAALLYGLDMAVSQLTSVYKISYSISGLSVSQILMLFIFASILGWLGACLSVKRQLAFIEPQ